MSDQISRNQIYSYVKTIINPYGKPFKGTAYELGLKIMDYIKNMSSVELPVRGEWIPCSERLPEGCKEAELEVLISTKEIYPDAYFNEAGFALYYPETKTFHSVYGDRLDITEIVIAWQYLPEPFSADREKVTE